MTLEMNRPTTQMVRMDQGRPAGLPEIAPRCPFGISFGFSISERRPLAWASRGASDSRGSAGAGDGGGDHLRCRAEVRVRVPHTVRPSLDVVAIVTVAVRGARHEYVVTNPRTALL